MFNIAKVVAEESYQDGQIIFEEGNSGDWMYVVLSGNVEISKTVGGKKVIIKKLQPEEVFGELGFLGSIKRTATVRAIGETTVGVVDREFLTKEFNKLSPEVRDILIAVVKRFKEIIDVACRLSTRT
jgi:CRP/FNR family cyclic AMP-dependent transcriptional regulator